MFALGMAMGPVVGGALLEMFWWGAAFLLAIPIVALLLVLAPFLLPEYRDPNSGRLKLFSVALSLAAMLPMVYGIKQIAKYGLTLDAGLAMVISVVFGVWFVSRQRRLVDPLLDIDLFKNKAFSVALTVLLFGLVAVGGTMLLVTQYLQLVAGYSPRVAGLWMGPPALAMVVAGVGAPLLARRLRPGYVVAGALSLSVLGYLMLSQVGGGEANVAMVVFGFSLSYLGLGTIAALGTNLVVGSAPPQKAGSASAMSETVQDLGVSLGIAILGSLATAIYRNIMLNRVSDDLTDAHRQAVSDSLWSALDVADALPVKVIEEAQLAFIAGFNGAAWFSMISVSILAVLAAVALRHVPPLGQSEHTPERSSS